MHRLLFSSSFFSPQAFCFKASVTALCHGGIWLSKSPVSQEDQGVFLPVTSLWRLHRTGLAQSSLCRFLTRDPLTTGGALWRWSVPAALTHPCPMAVSQSWMGLCEAALVGFLWAVGGAQGAACPPPAGVSVPQILWGAAELHMGQGWTLSGGFLPWENLAGAELGPSCCSFALMSSWDSCPCRRCCGSPASAEPG